MSRIVNQTLTQWLEAGAPFSSRQLSALTGVSRQAVHKHLRALVAQGRLVASGKARAVRYTPVVPLRQRVEVASAGSRYRLSARLLMLEVQAGEVAVDFTGVTELGEEFLEELFLVWAPAHPAVSLKVAHLPSKLALSFFAFARRSTSPVLSRASAP